MFWGGVAIDMALLTELAWPVKTVKRMGWGTSVAVRGRP